MKCDDICFQHILPRLNRTDVKFLYEVNTETRKLIKRSSREGDLKMKFWIQEMSSISTLEVAWENRENKSLWPSWWIETDFCLEVAFTNKLELLKWAREEKKCKWDEWTIYMAAEHGNLEMVKYCVANECPMYEDACAFAARNGHLEVLKYLREEGKAPWDSSTASWAALKGHLHILEYLVERKYNKYDAWACVSVRQKRSLRLFEVLARNRQSALGRGSCSRSAREQPPQNVCNTSSTTTAGYHSVGDTNMENCTSPNHHHNNNTNTSRARICFKALVITYTQRERDIDTPRALLSSSFFRFPQLGEIPRQTRKENFSRHSIFARTYSH